MIKPNLPVIAAIALNLAPSPASASGIEWSKSRPLTYSDFQGAIPNSPFWAYTYAEVPCTWSFDSNKVTSASCRTVFITNASWFRPEQSGNAALLSHEQGHFDIARFCKSNVLRAILTTPVAGLSSAQANARIQQTTQSQMQKCQQLQDLYDAETDHGSDSLAQSDYKYAISELITSAELCETLRPSSCRWWDGSL